MREEELQNLEKFEVFNEHGKISFKKPVDVTYINIDEIITIGPMYINVYNGHPPPYGIKLNKEARIHIYNYELSEEAENSDEGFRLFVVDLEEKIKKLGVSGC